MERMITTNELILLKYLKEAKRLYQDIEKFKEYPINEVHVELIEFLNAA